MAPLLRVLPDGSESTPPGRPALRLALAAALLLAACATPRPLPSSESALPAAAPAGDVAVHLVFGGEADLDLFVTDPMYEEIYFANAAGRLGGVFEGDRRCGDPAPRVETIRFPQAPAGRYRVSVDYPQRCDPGVEEVPYRVVVEAGSERREVEGTARFGRLEQIAVEFDVAGERRAPGRTDTGD